MKRITRGNFVCQEFIEENAEEITARINAAQVLHRSEVQSNYNIEKKTSRLDREEILLNDNLAWGKLAQIIKKENSGRVTEQSSINKRSRKALAKKFKMGTKHCR